MSTALCLILFALGVGFIMLIILLHPTSLRSGPNEDDDSPNGQVVFNPATALPMVPVPSWFPSMCNVDILGNPFGADLSIGRMED